jgi:general secretion pathway protein M
MSANAVSMNKPATGTSSALSSPKSARAVALGLAAFAALLVAAAIVVPSWLVYERYDGAATKLARQLKSYTTLNQQRPELLKAVEELKGRDTKRYFVKGATAALAGADLQDVAKAVIEASGGRVLSSQLLAHKDDGAFRQVSATMQLTATMQNLRQVLHALEGREPYMYLDNLTVRAQVPPGFKPQAGFEPEVFVQFDVSAYAPIPPSEAASGADARGDKASGKAGANGRNAKTASAGAKP